MATSYMASMSNGPDFIFVTQSHYQYHFNLQGASEQQRTDLFVLLFKKWTDCYGQMHVGKILYMLASLAAVCVCVCPPLLCM